MTEVTDVPGGHDRTEPVDIQVEMQRSYIDYAMSVIIGRALPDVRDGLKPVHTRILYAMFDGGFRPDRGYFKCSRVVGDVMGQYHPHGDSAIYDALVRLGQDWSMRYPLIDSQGNFGSPGNDPPAAVFLDVHDGAHRDRAAPGAIRLADAAPPDDQAGGREVRTGDALDQPVEQLRRYLAPAFLGDFFRAGHPGRQ